MKTHPVSGIIACLFALCCLCGLSGCASMDASNQESLLTAAGFRIKTPQTTAQLAAYAEAPAYKVHRATVEGKTFYTYKDEKKGVAYVGGEAEYQKYQKFALQKQIAQDNIMAAQMNQTMAMNWYGAWGYGGYSGSGRYGGYGRTGAFWY